MQRHSLPSGGPQVARENAAGIALRSGPIWPESFIGLEENERVLLVLSGFDCCVVLPLLRNLQRLLNGLVALHHSVLYGLQRTDQLALLCVRVSASKTTGGRR